MDNSWQFMFEIKEHECPRMEHEFDRNEFMAQFMANS